MAGRKKCEGCEIKKRFWLRISQCDIEKLGGRSATVAAMTEGIKAALMNKKQ